MMKGMMTVSCRAAGLLLIVASVAVLAVNGVPTTTSAPQNTTSPASQEQNPRFIKSSPGDGHRSRDHHRRRHHRSEEVRRPRVFDVNYCSVFASFPLIGARNGGEHESHSGEKNGYANYGYGYDKSKSKEREFDRQTCRYSATFSHKACQTCCRVSSRSANTNTHEIHGALFAFNPRNPLEERPEQAGPSNLVLQCVCCAPRHL